MPNKIGPWVNLYAGDEALAGVSVSQYGDGSDERQRAYIVGKHPAMIVYTFWNGSVRGIGYNPDGTVFDDSWRPKSDWLKPGSGDWYVVDFIYGSDPTFAKHKDPRVNPKFCIGGFVSRLKSKFLMQSVRISFV